MMRNLFPRAYKSHISKTEKNHENHMLGKKAKQFIANKLKSQFDEIHMLCIVQQFKRISQKVTV